MEDDDDGLVTKHFILIHIVSLLSIFQHMMKGTQWITTKLLLCLFIIVASLSLFQNMMKKEINVRLQKNLFFFSLYFSLLGYPSLSIFQNMIYLYFNHPDRYKQKSGEQGNKCYYTKLPKEKKDQRQPHPTSPPLIAPSHPTNKRPSKSH